jgi:hypothetical protein
MGDTDGGLGVRITGTAVWVMVHMEDAKKKERRHAVDALASSAEEGRGDLR